MLGAISLAIAALDRVDDVGNRFKQWKYIRLEHSRCKNDLKLHRLDLMSNLRQLLPLVVDDTTVDQLLADPGGKGWKDPSIDDLLRDRLGERYELYFEYIRGMEMVMHEVREELAADSDAIQEKLNTPVSLQCGP